MAKARKYHRVKSYPRKGGGRTRPHVRRMPKRCKLGDGHSLGVYAPT